jgi:hypothetical protein
MICLNANNYTTIETVVLHLCILQPTVSTTYTIVIKYNLILYVFRAAYVAMGYQLPSPGLLICSRQMDFDALKEKH